MAQHGARAGWDSPADRPSVLEITVESAPRRGAALGRVHVVIAVAVVGAIVAAIAIAALPGSGGGSAPRSSPAPQMPAPEQPSVLVQSVWPPGTSPSPQGGDVTVVLQPVGGSSRGTPEPSDATCSQPPVPPLARGKVRACRR